ncbi:MAG TPA: hypothetical protein VG963_18850 [Polyangiaceae bacterium]|nr:hypothetical protein [Polyangiaceae bacterium]
MSRIEPVLRAWGYDIEVSSRGGDGVLIGLTTETIERERKSALKSVVSDVTHRIRAHAPNAMVAEHDSVITIQVTSAREREALRDLLERTDRAALHLLEQNDKRFNALGPLSNGLVREPDPTTGVPSIAGRGARGQEAIVHFLDSERALVAPRLALVMGALREQLTSGPESQVYRAYLVHTQPMVSAGSIDDTYMAFAEEPPNLPYVGLELNADGAALPAPNCGRNQPVAVLQGERVIATAHLSRAGTRRCFLELSPSLQYRDLLQTVKDVVTTLRDASALPIRPLL